MRASVYESGTREVTEKWQGTRRGTRRGQSRLGKERGRIETNMAARRCGTERGLGCKGHDRVLTQELESLGQRFYGGRGRHSVRCSERRWRDS